MYVYRYSVYLYAISDTCVYTYVYDPRKIAATV